MSSKILITLFLSLTAAGCASAGQQGADSLHLAGAKSPTVKPADSVAGPKVEKPVTVAIYAPKDVILNRKEREQLIGAGDPMELAFTAN